MKRFRKIPVHNPDNQGRPARTLHLPLIAPILFTCAILAIRLPVVGSFAPSLVFPSALSTKKNCIFASAKASRKDENGDDDDLEPVQLPLGVEETLTGKDLEGLTVPQLKQQLRLRGLKVGGRKRDLIDRLLSGTLNSPGTGFDESANPGSTKTVSKAREFAEERQKELVDVENFLEGEDQGKQVKTFNVNEVIDADFQKDEEKDDSTGSKGDNTAEVWGSEARIVDDYEGRRVVVDSLSQLVVEFKGSNQSYVSALVVASRDALKPFLSGGEKAGNRTQAELRLREIQAKREQANQIPARFGNEDGLDEGDEDGLYTNVLSRDWSDWGKYTVTGAQLSAGEVQGVLLLSDVYGPFSADTQALAEKIAFECQPVVVMVPDLFRGHPWKEDSATPGTNKKGETYEEWRATHSDLRVSIDIRAAAACLRDRYGVSSIVVWGTCYGGGRALEAAAGYIPDGRIHDVDGSVGPPHVNPMAAVAWYPTRYDASALFGNGRIADRQRTEIESVDFAVMAVFAGKDVIPGATSDDASKLKELLREDPRCKDSLVKVFPDQDHGFAHIGLATKSNVDKDTAFERFVDDEFGGAGAVGIDDGEADVACLLSTAFMETYSRVFLPTVGAPIASEGEGWSTDLEMKSLSNANTRDVRREIEESLDSFAEEPQGGIDPTDKAQRKEMEALLRSMHSKFEEGDDLDTMYSKLKAGDLELF